MEIQNSNSPEVNAVSNSLNANITSTGKGSNGIATLKLLSSKTHVGPANVNKSGNKKDLLSKAANKIRLNNDLKVEFNDSDSTEKKSSKGNMVVELIGSDNKSLAPTTAFAFMEAWRELYHDSPGTKAYIDRANKLNAIRSRVYESLGIIPRKGERPELTEEQRLAYSEAVRPYSFDYYEVRLSYKQPGHKAIRSKSYRMLEAPDLNAMKSRLIKKMREVNAQWTITSR